MKFLAKTMLKGLFVCFYGFFFFFFGFFFVVVVVVVLFFFFLFCFFVLFCFVCLFCFCLIHNSFKICYIVYMGFPGSYVFKVNITILQIIIIAELKLIIVRMCK